MNILIINLTRFGDLIQTQPVISGYVSLGYRVGLVCLENFASAATLLDGVSEVFPFPGAGLLSKLDEDWRLAVQDATEFKANVLESFQPDRTVNLTPSVSSRLLTHDLAPISGDIAGFTVDDFGFNADTSMWAAYLQMAGINRGASPFNICDIFRRTAGLANEGNSLELARPSDEILAKAKGILSETMPNNGKGFIAIQMGASEERRRWPVSHFTKMAETLWEHDRLVPVLLGTKGEQHLGEKFKASTNCPVIDLIRKTSLLELAGVLSKCDALATNDTGTMHLAAGLGVPICGVFLATAQPFDTGPYRAGNICLEPDLDCHPCDFGKPCPNGHLCRHEVSTEVVYDSLKYVMAGKSDIRSEGARVWLSQVGSDGFMEQRSLSGHETTDRAIWLAIQRVHYLPFLDGGLAEKCSGLANGLSPEIAAEVSNILTSAHDMVFLLSQQGMLLARNPRPQAKNKFLASWQRFQTILNSSNYLDTLAKMWMFESQQFGDDLASLLQMTERYRAFIASLQGEFR